MSWMTFHREKEGLTDWVSLPVQVLARNLLQGLQPSDVLAWECSKTGGSFCILHGFKFLVKKKKRTAMFSMDTLFNGNVSTI